MLRDSVQVKKTRTTPTDCPHTDAMVFLYFSSPYTQAFADSAKDVFTAEGDIQEARIVQLKASLLREAQQQTSVSHQLPPQRVRQIPSIPSSC